MTNNTADTSSNPAGTSTSSGVNNNTEATIAMYTKLNLAAVNFTYPPTTPDIKHCPCDSSATPPARQNASNFIRIYHTEPSAYAYNRDSWLIRETRYNAQKGWHAPNDDLVADDAAPGSPVAAAGWWVENQEVGHEVWETRVYYIDKAGNIRERTNRTWFGPTGAKDDFDSALPQPEKLVPPTPGWAITPLANDAEGTAPNIVPILKTTPLRGSKLAALKIDGGSLQVFYQASDESIRAIEHTWGDDRSWIAKEGAVVAAGKAKAGTPLAALLGGWLEHRLFYVTPGNKLAGAYGDAHTKWRDIEPLSYQLSPSAMISAVAWNYATKFFEIRIYTTDNEDALYEMTYSRQLGGWKLPAESVAPPVTSPGLKSLIPGGDDGPPLSAVAAVLLEDSWKTKVYFHPRRIIIDEWDACAKAPAFGAIPKVSTTAAERRDIEEKTRALIKEDEERKAREAERKRQEEEAARRREEEQKRGQPQPKPAPKLMLNDPIVVMGDLSSAPNDIDDVYVRVDNLPFAVTLYGVTTKTVWISDNGTMSLDGGNPGLYTDKLSRQYKDAKPLPCSAADFSKYALFPMWVDLKICKGRKHGVFYQVSGTAPARTLTVEWLVTQYGAESDYYHFSAALEEQRPGVVTYKYNAVDGSAGTRCTVGVQGGGHHIQFTHNGVPHKIEPGLQLKFDTSKGTCSTSHFRTTARH